MSFPWLGLTLGLAAGLVHLARRLVAEVRARAAAEADAATAWDEVLGLRETVDDLVASVDAVLAAEAYDDEFDPFRDHEPCRVATEPVFKPGAPIGSMIHEPTGEVFVTRRVVGGMAHLAGGPAPEYDPDPCPMCGNILGACHGPCHLAPTPADHQVWFPGITSKTPVIEHRGSCGAACPVTAEVDRIGEMSRAAGLRGYQVEGWYRPTVDGDRITGFERISWRTLSPDAEGKARADRDR